MEEGISGRDHYRLGHGGNTERLEHKRNFADFIIDRNVDIMFSKEQKQPHKKRGALQLTANSPRASNFLSSGPFSGF